MQSQSAQNIVTPKDAADPKAGRKLIWNDEFTGTGRPNQKEWIYEKGKVRNNEAQYYTVDRVRNARIVNGRLVIQAHKEKFEGADVTSASLTTRQAWTNVYVEVKAKYPTGRGTWPAIWMLGESIRKPQGQGFITWPDCGEIDMLENVGFDPEVVHFTVHTASNNHMKGNQLSAQVRVPKGWESFHTYGMDWRDDRLDFYFNGKKVFTYKNEKTGLAQWPFTAPHYLILNLAIGGGWGGAQGIDDAIFPSTFEVDYVRIYK